MSHQPRYVIVGGGEPTREQLAALAVALTPVAAPTEQPRPAMAAWLRAAIHEGTGGRILASADDVLALQAPD